MARADKGLDTVIGEGGVKVSGGKKQGGGSAVERVAACKIEVAQIDLEALERDLERA